MIRRVVVAIGPRSTRRGVDPEETHPEGQPAVDTPNSPSSRLKGISVAVSSVMRKPKGERPRESIIEESSGQCMQG